MAKINWRERPSLLLEYYIENASVEYGKSTALRWADEIAAFEERLQVSLRPILQSVCCVQKKLFIGVAIL